MNYLDLINSLFELLSSLAIVNHIRILIKDKNVKGVSIVSTIFFTLWGFWNIFYYPSIGQTLSSLAGVLVCLANAVWVFLMIRYRKQQNKESMKIELSNCCLAVGSIQEELNNLNEQQLSLDFQEKVEGNLDGQNN